MGAIELITHALLLDDIYKDHGPLGSISTHGKLFIKRHDFIPNCQLDIIGILHIIKLTLNDTC